MDIFITEKPSVAMTYAKALKVKGTKNDGYLEGYSPVLGKDIQITWAVGHLITLGNVDEQREGKKITDKDFKPARWSKDTLPIIPQSYVYKENPTTYKQFNVVKKLYKAKDVDTIYYAGDSGREGIYIQALIRNQIFNKKFDDLTTPSNVKNEKVVWIDSQTDETIINGIKTAKPYSAYKDMIASGYKRAIADWLIGMNFTQVFTLTSGGLIVVGRVMTPTLAMIVKRQKEIDEFVKTNYYGIKSGNAKWRAVEGSRFFDSPALYNDTGFLKKADAEDLQAEFKKLGNWEYKSISTGVESSNFDFDYKLLEEAAMSHKVKYRPFKSHEFEDFEEKDVTELLKHVADLTIQENKFNEYIKAGYKGMLDFTNDKYHFYEPLMYGDAKEFMRLNPGKVAHCKKYCGDNMRVDTYTDVKQFSLHLKEKSRQYSLFDYMII